MEAKHTGASNLDKDEDLVEDLMNQNDEDFMKKYPFYDRKGSVPEE
jgi:hypothetical protein